MMVGKTQPRYPLHLRNALRLSLCPQRKIRWSDILASRVTFVYVLLAIRTVNSAGNRIKVQ